MGYTVSVKVTKCELIGVDAVMQWTLITRDTANGTAIHECPACYGSVTADDMPGARIEDIVEDAVKGDYGCDRCDNARRPNDAAAAAAFSRVIEPWPGSALAE